MMTQLKRVFRTSDRIFFHGAYDLPADPLMPERDHVNTAAYEIWKVTGYRFK
jgi:hypothetical protein